jgi:hypothetical protein
MITLVITLRCSPGGAVTNLQSDRACLCPGRRGWGLGFGFFLLALLLILLAVFSSLLEFLVEGLLALGDVSQQLIQLWCGFRRSGCCNPDPE